VHFILFYFILFFIVCVVIYLFIFYLSEFVFCFLLNKSEINYYSY